MTTMSVVGECFFWYRLTRVVPDNFHRAVKRLCVFFDTTGWVTRLIKILLDQFQESGTLPHDK